NSAASSACVSNHRFGTISCCMTPLLSSGTRPSDGAARKNSSHGRNRSGPRRRREARPRPEKPQDPRGAAGPRGDRAALRPRLRGRRSAHTCRSDRHVLRPRGRGRVPRRRRVEAPRPRQLRRRASGCRPRLSERRRRRAEAAEHPYAEHRLRRADARAVVSFVPDEFEPPRRFEAAGLVLEPLGPQHNEADYAAWTSSIEHIRATPGYPDGTWPHEMTLDENRRDLERHAADFEARTGFTYTVLERGRVVGCVYVYPDGVRSWVTADRAELDAPLRTAVRAWLHTSWPFEELDDAP